MIYLFTEQIFMSIYYVLGNHKHKNTSVSEKAGIFCDNHQIPNFQQLSMNISNPMLKRQPSIPQLH